MIHALHRGRPAPGWIAAVAPSLILLGLLHTAHAAVIHVPADQPTVQAGIDAATEGDEVLVAPGTYVELVDFLVKGITVRSEAGPFETVLDGDRDGPVVAFDAMGTVVATLEGFTIRNGRNPEGGGIFISGSSPIIRRCIVSGNVASVHAELPGPYHSGTGGGIYCTGGSPTITSCILSKNEAQDHITLGSPCVDSGLQVTVTVDLDGEEGPLGQGVDMGADEYTDPDCRDDDADRYGHPSCGGYDCDDANPDVNPGAQEVCDNGIDDDCDGLTDAWDTDCCVDSDGDGFPPDTCGGPDCDDTDPAVHPGAPEICDLKDSDCDGSIPFDEQDLDGDQWGICSGDCDDTTPEANPGAVEGTGPGNCDDGLDNDCDGTKLAEEADEDPDCFPVYRLELGASHAEGTLSLAFTRGLSGPAAWVTSLALTVPEWWVIPPWTLPLEAIDPPVTFSLDFPFPSVGWVGIYSGLITSEGEQTSDLAIVDTGMPRSVIAEPRTRAVHFRDERR